MIRFGLGILVATTACAAFGVAACGDTIPPGQGTPGGTGGANAGGGGATNGGGGTTAGGAGSDTPTPCVGDCCPASAACYSGPEAKNAWGAECQATRDNTGQDHIQMRQAWIKATTPFGNTSSTVYSVLSGRTQIPAPDCHQGLDKVFGSGGYIQIIDFFLGGSKMTPAIDDFSTVGYSTFVPGTGLADTLSKGFCFGNETFNAKFYPTYALTTAAVTNPSDAVNYPKGLPLPMGAVDGWKVGSTKAKRITEPFEIPKDRVKLLAMFDDANPDNIKKDGYTGVFTYDEATGTAHGFGSIGWVVVYNADGSQHLSIPIREVETKSTFNNPKHPDCVGAYRAGALDPANECLSQDPASPAWGCLNDSCPYVSTLPGGKAKGEGPATTSGYFLITELDQLYTPDLQSTLCVSYAGTDAVTKKPFMDAEGFFNPTDKSCRTAKWHPELADHSGIPKGDWCAATNSSSDSPEAKALNCHDAWHSESFHVFVGGKIQVPADPKAPMTTCTF